MNLFANLSTVYLCLGIAGGGGILGLAGYLTHGAAQLARRDLTAAEAQIADLAEAGRIRAELLAVQKSKIVEQGTRLAAQEQEIGALKSRVAELEARVAELLRRLGEQALASPVAARRTR